MADQDGITKRCTKCGIEKPLQDFPPGKKAHHSPTAPCRVCRRAINALYRADPRHKATAKILQAAWRASNPDRVTTQQTAYNLIHKDEIRARDLAYRTANREKKRVTTALWRKAHPEWAKRLTDEWNKSHPGHWKAYRAANPGQFRAYWHKRRALEREAPGTFTKTDIADIQRMQRDRCAVCRRNLKGLGHIDHIIALSKGGSNFRSNLQLLCRSCNSSKNDHDPIDFMRSRGMLL